MTSRKKTLKPGVTLYAYRDVNPDGTFKDETGSIYTGGHLAISQPVGGCEIGGCKCTPGHWVSAALPITKDGTVLVIRFTFKSRTDLLKYLKLSGK